MLLVFCVGRMQAETVRVIVGETGCAGRQIAVRECWEKISGVSSVTVLPRQPAEPPARRTFIIVATATAPSAEALRAALGRRAKNYPILDFRKEPDQPALHKSDP
jgi:hypothetical protein